MQIFSRQPDDANAASASVVIEGCGGLCSYPSAKLSPSRVCLKDETATAQGKQEMIEESALL